MRSGVSGKLPILSAGEQQQMAEWNRTEAGYPGEKTVVELFEEQVERIPGGVAVVFEGEELSYGELNGRANQLAHYLRGLGVGREVLVGICVERSLEMVVGLLGILKAGGAYVPLDPSYPPERLRYMVEDAQATVVLTQERLRELLPEGGARVVLLDGDWEQVQGQSVWNPESAAGSDNLAYVIYTSGSTGKPKGAMIRHQGLTNYLRWCTWSYAVERGCGAPVHSSIGFDLTVTSLFPPLLVGGCLELLRGDGIEALATAIHKGTPYSLIKITPAHLEALRQMLDSKQLSSCVRSFIIGGEALMAESVLPWREYAPETRLINEYGPTETVVGCCVYEIPLQDHVAAGPVPIGRPIVNTQIHVLDEHLQRVPLGARGELYVGGDGVARGYWRRPELTAENFVPDPFGVEAGARMYRTGDRVRYLPDGNLEFLGRFDDQVKIRGYRVEVAEVRTILEQHPAVQQALVIAREDQPGDKRLVAYVVSRAGDSASLSEMRKYLRERLPEYMVPTAFVFLRAFPLTVNGK